MLGAFYDAIGQEFDSMRFSSMSTQDRHAVVINERTVAIPNVMQTQEFKNWYRDVMADAVGKLADIVAEFQAPNASLGPEAVACLGFIQKVNVVLVISSLSASGGVFLCARDVGPVQDQWPTVILYLREHLGRGHYEHL